jgi:aminoglycoside phosphotransferase family enzyme/predicted kinase
MEGKPAVDEGHEHLERIIQGLLEPAAYPHPVRDLHLAQTHASCVFLTGDYAYKVKKPVDFGFLDYQTLAARRQFCEQEVTLNRRLCPDVYLGVVPVVAVGTRLRLGGPGEPVEWAVRMRQLPEAEMLPRRLAAGTVTAAEMRAIASVLADFHAKAARGPAIRAYGTPEAIARNTEENFTQTEARVGPVLPAGHLAAIRSWTRRFLREHDDLFRRRVAQDRICDAHGDLRAQNICLDAFLPGGVQIFDCIEFNERFRCCDPAADLAYLAMDLDLAGRADLRAVLVEEYLARPGDGELAQLLPFYQAYRAYVRGKIALFSAAETEIPAAQRAAEQQLAACAFDLARSYTHLAGRPWLLITTGLPGSGKSSVARELARRLPAAVHASDAARKELAGRAAWERLPAEAYAPERTAQVYAELRRRASASLAQGLHTLLDATFLAPEQRAAAADLARACGAAFAMIDCWCPETVARERIAARAAAGNDPSDAGLAVYEAQRAGLEGQPGRQVVGSLGSASPNDPLAIPLKTDRPPAELAREVLQALWGPAG